MDLFFGFFWSEDMRKEQKNREAWMIEIMMELFFILMFYLHLSCFKVQT